MRDAVKRRLGSPKTNTERKKRHKARFGTSKLPFRGSGLKLRGGK